MSAYSEVAEAIEQIILTAYAEEGYKPIHDRIHESLGHDGRTYIGISPDYQSPQPDNYSVLDTGVTVQFYGSFDLDVDPKQRKDPRIIAAKAEKFMKAVRDYAGPTSGNMWFINVTGIDYPNDPTGNKTRFEATLVAKAYNPTLVETG